jgi:hypothetical protein
VDSQRGGERLALERFGWFAAPDFTFTPGTPLPLATQAPPCSLRAMATERLNSVGVKWREAFVGGGVAIIGAAVEAGIAVSGTGPDHLRAGSSPFAPHAATGFGCRAIASTITAATMHNAPAAKNAGR